MLQTLLQKRSNGYYYFRWVCPTAIRKILGKREIIKSLRTTSKIQALARAGTYYMVVEKLKALYESLNSDQSAWAEAFEARDKFLTDQEAATAYASAYAHAKTTSRPNAEGYAEAYLSWFVAPPDFESDLHGSVINHFESGLCAGASGGQNPPEFNHETYLNSDFFKEAYFAKFPKEYADIEIEKVKAKLTNCYMSDVPRYSKALLELAEIFKPSNLEEVRKKRAEIQACLDMHREAATNLEGEFGDGKQIKNEIAQAFAKAISCDEFEYEEISEFDFDAGDRAKAQALVQKYVFYKLGNFQYLFWCYPELLNKYFYEIEQVLFEFYLRIERNLTPESKKPVLPDFLTPTVPSSTVAMSQTVASLRFSGLFEKFMDHKISMNDLTLENQKEYRNYFDVVVRFIGDLPIDSITKRHIKDCLTQYGTLPRRNKKPYKDMELDEILKIDVPDSDRVAPKTVGQVRRMIQGIFRYAVDQELVKQSPAVDLNLDLEKTNARGAYSKTQLKALLAGVDSFNGKDEWKKWVLRLGVYTGARAGEMAQLRRQDVKQDEDSGIYYLLITKKAGAIKTDNALRQIPLHSALIEMGFLDYVGRQDGKVFPTLNGSAPISKWFPLYRKSQGIADSTDFDEKLVFHGFRHSMVTFLRGAGANDAQVQQIVGHEKTGAGITDRYTQRIELSALKTVIELFQI